MKSRTWKSKAWEEQGGRLMDGGCSETKDVGNGQRQHDSTWARIHEIQRRLVQGRLEAAGGWSRLMPGSYQVNGSSEQMRSWRKEYYVWEVFGSEMRSLNRRGSDGTEDKVQQARLGRHNLTSAIFECFKGGVF